MFASTILSEIFGTLCKCTLSWKFGDKHELSWADVDGFSIHCTKFYFVSHYNIQFR